MAGEPIIDIEGLVYVADWEDNSDTIETVTLDDLVARAVSHDMLEDEPQAVDLLLKFRQRLMSSLEHVNTALKSLSEARGCRLCLRHRSQEPSRCC